MKKSKVQRLWGFCVWDGLGCLVCVQELGLGVEGQRVRGFVGVGWVSLLLVGELGGWESRGLVLMGGSQW